jgi:hypothetical protein
MPLVARMVQHDVQQRKHYAITAHAIEWFVLEVLSNHTQHQHKQQTRNSVDRLIA